MQLDEAAGRGPAQRGDPPGLGAGLVLRQHPPGGEVQRVLGADLLGRRPVLHRRGTGPGRPGWRSGRRRAGACPGRPRSGQGQKTPFVGVDPLPGDAGVVGRPAGRGPPQLRRRPSARIGREGRAGASEPGGQVGEDRQVGADAGRAAARSARRRSTRPSRLVIVPSSSAHWAIGSTTSASAAVSESTKSATTSRSRSRSRRSIRAARGAETTGLEPKTSSARGPSGRAERVEQLVRGHARSGQVVGGHAPHPGDVRAGRRVVDPPVAGELVGLLPVLPPALAVALPGEAAVAGAGAAGQAEGEGQVDEGGDRVDALGVLLGAARGEDDRACRRCRAPGRWPPGRPPARR